MLVEQRERNPTDMSLRSAPSLSVSLHESPQYQTLGVGLTDDIFLLGHADGLNINDPYKVLSVREALSVMNADAESPLVMALLEAYMAGARDIWVMAVAPMSEYEPDLDLRDVAYYTQYRERLNEAYNVLKAWDVTQFTVPLDAPFNYEVDFLGPLASYCVDAFNLSGEIHLGIMGTRGEITDAMVDAMANDGRLERLGDAGKFVSVFTGDGTFNLQAMPLNHTSSVATSVAALVAQSSLDRGVTYQKLRHIIRITGDNLSKEQINTLAEAGINVVGPNIMGRRGQSYQIIPYSDNTLAAEGSDYWSLTQMRLVSSISSEVRTIGKRKLGTIGFGLFKDDVREYMTNLVKRGGIREYSLDFYRDNSDPYKVYVDIMVKPFFGVRELNVAVTVGPGA